MEQDGDSGESANKFIRVDVNINTNRGPFSQPLGFSCTMKTRIMFWSRN